MTRRMCELLTTVLISGWLYSACLTQAEAQNPQCPTRPFGDNSNACASTAFVQTAITGLGFVVGPASAGNSDVALFDGTTGKLIKDSGVGIGTTGTNLGRLDTANTWSASPQVINVSQNTATFFLATNSNAGTAAFASHAAGNGTGSAGFGIGGTGYTGIVLLQNRAFITATSASAGIAINNEGANPTIFSISNTEVARIASATVLTITPAANTVNKGLSITQSGPTGSTAGPLSYSTITTTFTSGIATGSGGLPYNQQQRSLFVTANVIGNTAVFDQQFAGVFFLNDTSTSISDKAALVGIAYKSAGSNSNGALEGADFSSIVDAGATSIEALGVESEVIVSNTATVTDRMAYKAHASKLTTGTWTGVGSRTDAAYVAVAESTGAPFVNLIKLTKFNLGVNTNTFPIASTGSLFSSDVTGTITTGFDFTGITVSGNILTHSNVTLSGAGALALSMSTSAAIPLTLTSTNADAVFGPKILLDRNSASPAVADVLGVLTYRGRNSAAGSIDYVALYPITTNVTAASESASFNVETYVAGTSTVIATFGGTGGVGIGTTVPGVAGVVNVLTGFRIGNAAATGTILRGNGTNYIASTSTYPDTVTINRLLYASSANVVAGLATANSSILVTDSGGIPSLSTTVPAHTLGGTISGGGNQINNVIIGTITPLAGSFTTLIASTSVTSPIHYGGSAAGSTLTLASTSGSGSSDKLIFQTASQTYRGGFETGGLFKLGPDVASNTGVLLTVNRNTVALQAPGLTQAIAQFGGANSENARVYIDGYGGSSSVVYRRANTSAASPAAVTTSDVIGAFIFHGYQSGGAYVTDGPALFVTATQPFTSANQGTKFEFYNVGTNANTSTVVLTFNPTNSVSVGTAVSGMAVGDFSVSGQVYLTNTAADTATTDATVCRATGSSPGGKIITGTGALGVCLGTSGAQFKTGFVPMQAGLDELVQIRFENYYYRNGWGDNGARLQYGTTAQNVERILPDLVRHNATGEAINYDNGALLFIGLHAIQQLKADNDNLRNELDKLKRRTAL